VLYVFVMCAIIITGSTSLRVLSFSNNPIGNDGISLIVDHLHDNTTLTELRVHDCGLSAKGNLKCRCSVILYIKLSVCFVTLITQQIKHVSIWDFDKIKRLSSGNSKLVVTKYYMLSFVLYTALKAFM